MSAKKKKSLSEGTRISVYCAWTDTWLEGTVDVLLSSQFAWETDDGRRFITHYDGGWKHVEKED